MNLLGILDRVRTSICGRDIDIDYIDHKPYLEVYYFTRGEEHCRVNINYSGKSKITNVLSNEVNQLGTDLLQFLSGLKAGIITSGKANESEQFSEDFLNQFHLRITELAADRGLSAPAVQQYNYCQRYTFTRGHEVAVFNIFYTSKKQFSRCEPLNSLSTQGPLISEIADLITEGMS
ncbi:hypothetical protein [Alishewanella sp. HL-SH05]|uniref:hypothetical protein n=1 Tax=Alishewanella sp. HL-SH05 TaxID=3461145 RepID=UPI004041E2F4